MSTDTQNCTDDLLLGIDGGATGTDFALASTDGRVIRSLHLSSSNPFDIGMDKAQTVLSEGITQMLDNIDPARVCLFAGLSGGKTGGNLRHFREFFSLFRFRAFDCDSDIATAVAVGLRGENGIAVIAGTGSALCISKDGCTEIIGGHGYLFDRGCSGYDLGLAALSECFRVRDGAALNGRLSQLVNEKCGGDVNSKILDFYNNGKALIASFAPLVFQAAEEGDPASERMIGESAASLAALIRAGLKKLAPEDRRAVIVGGMTRFEGRIRPALEEKLADCGVKLSFCREKPINGALFLAGKLSTKQYGE